MAARTVFFLIVTLTVMQNARADLNITTNTDAFHNLSKLVEQWNKTVGDVVNKMKNETEKMIYEAKEAFDDIRKDVEEAIKDGKCVVDNKSFTEHIKSGVKEVTTCVKQAAADLQPLVEQFIDTMNKITILINKCAPVASNGVTLTLCAFVDVIIIAKDVQETVTIIQTTYTTLDLKMKTCESNLQSEIKEIRQIVKNCTDQ